MSAAEFFAASRVLIVAGKGGVGKTTVCASMGVAAARTGLRVMLVELEGRSILGRSLGHADLDYEGTELIAPGSIGGGSLTARRITPDDALVDYLGRHGLDRVAGRLVRSGAVEIVATAAPGIRDLLALGKIRQLEQAAEVDLILVDAPAAGHAVTFLRAPAGLAQSGDEGPVKEQAEQVLAMLTDEHRCQVVLVTLPEETPVNELIETAFSLEEDVGVKLGPVVVNAAVPPLTGLDGRRSEIKKGRSKRDRARRRAADYRLAREATQRAEVERLTAELPLPTITLPFLFTTNLERSHLEGLADVIIEELGDPRA